MGRLQGKIAMITGAGTGIGRACMRMFANEGATVFGVSRTQSNLDETLKLVQQAGAQGSVYSADLSDPDRGEAAVKQCIAAYGRIDILLNAAGVGYSHNGHDPGLDRVGDHEVGGVGDAACHVQAHNQQSLGAHFANSGFDFSSHDGARQHQRPRARKA